MRDYTQLTQEERYQIEALLKRGHHQSGIADALNRDKSTISREVSRSPVLLTLAERRTRYSIIAKAPDKSAQAVTDALLTALQPHTDLLHTLTYDNGKEFAYHQAVAKGFDVGLLRPPLPFLGARTQREHQRAHPSVPAQGHRFPDSHT